MPRASKALTDTAIKALKPKDKRYLVGDTGGLVLEVMTSGSKVWRYRYTLFSKRQPLLTIGKYPEVSLKAARERRDEWAELVASESHRVSRRLFGLSQTNMACSL